MNYSENYKLNKPQRNEQFNLDHWNENTDKIDSVMNTNRTNIANNASNISTILTGLSTINTSDRDSVYYKLMKLIYPVGSLYWSSRSTNPGTLFGGTWTQIKDKFVLACGDTYKTTGATGGASTVTLSVSNMPSHTHSFTPSGTVSSHSHSFTPSGTVSSHSHSFTPSGTVSSHHHTGPSHSHSFTPSGTVSSHSHPISSSSSWIGVSDVSNVGDLFKDDGDCGAYNAAGHWRFRKYLFTGNTGDTSPSFTGTAGTTNLDGTGDTGDTSPSFTGTAGDTGDTSPSFTGTAGDTGDTSPSFTGTAGNTGANGSGSSFSILPPYVVKYCWERTA